MPDKRSKKPVAPYVAKSVPDPQEEHEHFNLGRSTVPPALYDPEQRRRYGLPEKEDEPGPYMIELNLLYSKGVQEAAKAFEALYQQVLGEAEAQKRPAVLISKTYFRCRIKVQEWKALTKKDEEQEDPGDRIIYKIWPDFPVKPLIDRSVATVKADAASRSYSATGEGICWAVIDSGIDMTHIHFGDSQRNPQYSTLLDRSVRDLHRDFTLDNPQPVPPPSRTRR